MIVRCGGTSESRLWTPTFLCRAYTVHVQKKRRKYQSKRMHIRWTQLYVHLLILSLIG